ncbi:MAG: PTS glucose transporter subunit IIA, partial [Lachnospiraceae bacterium]|nr:PTS glucose transporter subunit IIA [Lachnospiraceae bacterium]
MAEKFKLVAPVTGKCVDISQVPDETFAGRVLGDGVAFEFEGNEVCSPCSGEITMTAETNHAVGITADGGMEILLHVGIDTVALNGKGLTMLVKDGQKVKVGTPLIRVDRKYMKEQKINMITPMVLTNGEDLVYQLTGVGQNVTMGKTSVVAYDGVAQAASTAADRASNAGTADAGA